MVQAHDPVPVKNEGVAQMLKLLRSIFISPFEYQRRLKNLENQMDREERLFRLKAQFENNKRLLKEFETTSVFKVDR